MFLLSKIVFDKNAHLMYTRFQIGLFLSCYRVSVFCEKWAGTLFLFVDTVFYQFDPLNDNVCSGRGQFVGALLNQRRFVLSKPNI